MRCLNKPFVLAVALLLSCLMAYAQVGGKQVYEFVNLPSSARVTSLGGDLITIKDDDLSLAYHNPALLNPEMAHHMTVGTNAYVGQIGFGYAGYAWEQSKIGMMQTGMQYVNYGLFSRTDDAGNTNGKFTAADVAMNFGASHQYTERYSLGANVKLVASSYESYSSYGVLADLAAAYQDSSGRFSAGLVIKNIGAQIKPYTQGNRQPVPFEIQLGLSQRLKYVPFRFSVVLHDLQQFDIRYDDPDDAVNSEFLLSDSTQSQPGKKYIFDKIARHFIFGGEFYLGKSLRIGLGYNHQRRQEMKVDTRRALVGFSFGIGITTKKFDVSFARAGYHLAGASNHLTVALNFNEIISKQQVNSGPM